MTVTLVTKGALMSFGKEDYGDVHEPSNCMYETNRTFGYAITGTAADVEHEEEDILITWYSFKECNDGVMKADGSGRRDGGQPHISGTFTCNWPSGEKAANFTLSLDRVP